MEENSLNGLEKGMDLANSTQRIRALRDCRVDQLTSAYLAIQDSIRTCREIVAVSNCAFLLETCLLYK